MRTDKEEAPNVFNEIIGGEGKIGDIWERNTKDAMNEALRDCFKCG